MSETRRRDKQAENPPALEIARDLANVDFSIRCEWPDPLVAMRDQFTCRDE
jgi:hypothetical protein